MHQEYEDLLLLYTTHSLDESGRQRLEAHLETCAACRASLNEWRSLSAAVRRAAIHHAASLPALRLHDLEQEKNTMQPAYSLRRSNHYVPVTFAAIAVMLMFAAVAFFAPKPGSNTTVVLQAATETAISPTSFTTRLVNLVMPARNIENGSVIGADDVQLIPYPYESAPFNIVTSIDDAVGKIARTNILCNHPILSTMLAENARDVIEFIPPLNETFECPEGLPAGFGFTEVVVAVQNVTRWQEIPRNAVELRSAPSTLSPALAYTRLEDVVGEIALHDIFREEVITGQMLIGPIPQSERLPNGTVSVSVPVSRINAVPYGLQEADRVDVIATLLFVDVDENFQQLAATETPDANPVTQRIVSDAYVVYIGPVPSDNGELSDDNREVIMVAVSPQDAVVLTWLVEARIPLILVSHGSWPNEPLTIPTIP